MNTLLYAIAWTRDQALLVAGASLAITGPMLLVLAIDAFVGK